MESTVISGSIWIPHHKGDLSQSTLRTAIGRRGHRLSIGKPQAQEAPPSTPPTHSSLHLTLQWRSRGPGEDVDQCSSNNTAARRHPHYHTVTTQHSGCLFWTQLRCRGALTQVTLLNADSHCNTNTRAEWPWNTQTTIHEKCVWCRANQQNWNLKLTLD